MRWNGGPDHETLARTRDALARDARQTEATWLDEQTLMDRRRPPTLNEMRARLGAYLDYDDETRTWTAVIPAIGDGLDEVIQTSSTEAMRKALDAALRRRSDHTGASIRNQLAVLQHYWVGMYAIGWDAEADEYWAKHIDGTREIRAPNAEELNTMMANNAAQNPG